MSGLALLRPEWLLALPLVAGLGLWAWRRQRGLGDWMRAADPGLLRAMRAIGRVDGRGAAGAALLAPLAAGIVVLALTGPAVDRSGASAFRNLDGAVFVLDASPSMVAGPGWPDAVAAARIGLGALGAKPAALVVYAGDAYLAAPFTRDTAQLGLTVSVIEPGTVPDPGTRPERALAMAADLLAQADILAGDVVLITDGGGVGAGAMAAADRIAGAGAALSVVRIGTAPGEALETLARAGGGAVHAPADLDALRAALATGAGDRLAREDYALLFRADLGRYLLILALFPLLLLFRRAAP
ncbi:VWA domain-containing protein [Rhodovulum marinum]|uniref:Ca-activated chloride channel family protein n=1 Tax=Rhodovulum marinum TaxID=320662 RepID=A0A4R2Q1C8_9RHOB|nr:VWA domain-containing protein [Rhodovulum marinum]TCP40415.1 Ca-activated chloride channel family protein [Rhodovulum marinum]